MEEKRAGYKGKGKRGRRHKKGELELINAVANLVNVFFCEICSFAFTTLIAWQICLLGRHPQRGHAQRACAIWHPRHVLQRAGGTLSGHALWGAYYVDLNTEMGVPQISSANR